jgi:hypothetical protein
MMMRKPSTHDQGAVGVIAVGSVDDGSGDEIGDGIGGEGDMTGDGGVGDGDRRGVLDWCVNEMNASSCGHVSLAFCEGDQHRI